MTVTLPPEIIEYLQSKVESRDFASMAHGVELCVLRYKQADEKRKEEPRGSFRGPTGIPTGAP